jgi:hypothetical protein
MQRGESLMKGMTFRRWRLSTDRGDMLRARASSGRFSNSAPVGVELSCGFQVTPFVVIANFAITNQKNFLPDSAPKKRPGSTYFFLFFTRIRQVMTQDS